MMQAEREATIYPRRTGDKLTVGDRAVLVGQIGQVDESYGAFTMYFSSDNNGASVTVKVPQSMDLSDFKTIKFIEVGGQVVESNSIEMNYYTDFKDNFDLTTYNEMLKLATNQFRDLFNF